MNPSDNAVVLCVDEESQIQALERAQPLLPMDVAPPERQTGTTDLFAALDVATGTVLGKCYARHGAREFKLLLAEIDDSVLASLDVHVVLDNLSTHKRQKTHRVPLRHPRCHLHFTPTHASCLHQVERWFGRLTEPPYVAARIRARIGSSQRNEKPKPFRWTKSADDIQASIARFAIRTQ